MVRSAYLAPTEQSITSTDVKRALLTFDTVLISDPDDRDLIPPQAFMTAAFAPHGLPIPIAINTGPVRPIGKSSNYDRDFDQLMDEIQIARREGCIEVVSAFDRSVSSQLAIGGLPMGGYPLNPAFMLWAYRSIAREQEVLSAAIAEDEILFSLSDEEIEALSVSRSSGDFEITGDPKLPLLEGILSREHLREHLTHIARARIASTMKSIGYCASKNLVPVFGGGNFDGLVSLLSDRAAKVIDKAGDEDPYWRSRRRVMQIAHDEYINDDVLSAMPIDDVLKLRSKAWGEQAEARDELLTATAELAREGLREDDFDHAIRERIQSYKALAKEVEKQREVLSFNIRCDLLKGSSGAAFSVASGAALDGILSQVQTAIGAGTVLLAGCMWAVDRVQDWKPVSDQLRSAESEFKDNICFGVHDFYSRMSFNAGC